MTEEEVLKEIKDYHDKTGGKCGLGMVTLLRNLKTNYEAIRPLLLKLHKEEKIYQRRGLNDRLVFYGKKER